MKKIFIAANLFFICPSLLIYLLCTSDLGNVRVGVTTMLISISGLIGLILFYDDFSTKTEIKNHNTICNVLLVFENILYIIFFIGMLYFLNIDIIPKIGR